MEKKCTTCKQILALTCFHRNSSKKDGLSNRCKNCQKSITQPTSVKDRDRFNLSQRSRQKANVESGFCKFCKTTRAPGQERLCEKHYIVSIARLALGKGTNVEVEELRKKFELQKGKCPYTREHLSIGVDAHLDHIFPSSRFPELKYELSNVEWVSKKANLAKGDMTKDEFLQFCRDVISFAD